MGHGKLLARASVEFAFIVAGVLVGLWVNDWEQRRQDRAAAVALLARLESELVADAADLAVAEHRAQSRLWVLDAVLAKLGDRRAENRLTAAREDSILHPTRLDSLAPNRSPGYDFAADPLAPFRARGNFDLSMTTYEEMLATGRLRLVGADDLRASIASYYREAADRAANEDRDPYYERLEDAFASIDVAFGDSLSLDDLATRATRDPSFPVAARRAENSVRRLIAEYRATDRLRRRLEQALAGNGAGR